MNYNTILISFLLACVAMSVNVRPGESSYTTCEDVNRGITFDFQCGCLYGWTRTGNAFTFQPTLGDNPTARNRGLPSNHEGSYWIGGFENYTASEQVPGSVVGDEPTGTLTSKPFRIFSNYISFLIAGGDFPGIRLELIDFDTNLQLFSQTGSNTETLVRKRWDVSAHYGKYVYLRAVDEETAAWGHLNFDDIKFTN